jgi:hypothetical protein
MEQRLELRHEAGTGADLFNGGAFAWDGNITDGLSQE